MTKDVTLIVDDDVLLEHISRILGKNNFVVQDDVSDLNRGFRKVKRKKPDLVILEILPEEFDRRFNAVEKIQEKVDVPVICILDHSGDHVWERIKKANPYGAISRPIGEKNLMITVEIALNRRKDEKDSIEDKDRLIRKMRSLQSTLSREFFNKIKGSIKILNGIKNTGLSDKKEEDVDNAISKLREAHDIAKEDLRKVQDKKED